MPPPRPSPATREALRPFVASFWPFGIALVLLFAMFVPVEAQRSMWPRRDILDAIRQVESQGRESPPDGDNGLAIGPYQIHRVYWQDAIAFDSSLGGSYQDCRKRAYAEKVIDAYMRRHVPSAWKNGRAEILARVHNGGPQGFKINATLGYWKRVRNLLPP